MKAAIIDPKTGSPKYTDIPEPVPNHEDEVLITMKAVAIKNLDRSRASGTHYSIEAEAEKIKVIGGDGIGYLEDGTRVYAIGMNGMAAEKAVVKKQHIVRIPEGIDHATAAALPNAVAGAALAMKFRANMQKGDTVFINGATGFTGKVAVQLARLYGAKNIFVSGRNAESLKELLILGADKTISLLQDDDQILEEIHALQQSAPIDIIIDYLWGHSAELILNNLKGNGYYTHKTRFVSVGAMTGDKVQLSSEILRSTDLQISGSGLGSWTKEQFQQYFTQIVPEAFDAAAKGLLKTETVNLGMAEIEKIWDMDIANGKRLVLKL